jgi:hypothetical protein
MKIGDRYGLSHSVHFSLFLVWFLVVVLSLSLSLSLFIGYSQEFTGGFRSQELIAHYISKHPGASMAEALSAVSRDRLRGASEVASAGSRDFSSLHASEVASLSSSRDFSPLHSRSWPGPSPEDSVDLDLLLQEPAFSEETDADVTHAVGVLRLSGLDDSRVSLTLLSDLFEKSIGTDQLDNLSNVVDSSLVTVDSAREIASYFRSNPGISIAEVLNMMVCVCGCLFFALTSVAVVCFLSCHSVCLLLLSCVAYLSSSPFLFSSLFGVLSVCSSLLWRVVCVALVCVLSLCSLSSLLFRCTLVLTHPSLFPFSVPVLRFLLNAHHQHTCMNPLTHVSLCCVV